MNISLFLRENKQTEEGRFILFPEPNYQLLYNGSAPGKTRYFESDEEVRSESFPPDDNAAMYKPCLSKVTSHSFFLNLEERFEVCHPE